MIEKASEVNVIMKLSGNETYSLEDDIWLPQTSVLECPLMRCIYCLFEPPKLVP